MLKGLSVYWARRDLRITDNPALASAVNYAKENNLSFLPVFILEDYMLSGDPKQQFGYPSRKFLSLALPEFCQKFDSFLLTKGKAAETIIKLGKKYDVNFFVNEDIHPDFYKQIEKIKKANIKITVLQDALSIDKEQKTMSGNYYSIFTPFKKAVWNDFLNQSVLEKPNFEKIKFLNKTEINDLGLDRINQDEESIWKIFSKKRLLMFGDKIIDLDDYISFNQDTTDWYFTEKEAVKRFEKYLETKMTNYKNDRDYLSKDSTSKMSIGLCFGLVSARMLKQMVKEYFKSDFKNLYSTQNEGAIHFLSELVWREFYRYLYFHFPYLQNIEFQEKFRNNIKWENKDVSFNRFTNWIMGQTGYPIVDAAMMQIAKTGYMHNRSRMIVSSILSKNLGVDWRHGQEYFRAMLVDLDDASNNGGWQWGASVGADPKPIRIFNPYLQAKNYDKDMKYQKKYLSEEYFKNPPPVIIEHVDARQKALHRYGLDHLNDDSVRDY